MGPWSSKNHPHSGDGDYRHRGQNDDQRDESAHCPALLYRPVCVENLVRIGLMGESLNVGRDGRAALFLSDVVGLAVQIEETAVRADYKPRAFASASTKAKCRSGST